MKLVFVTQTLDPEHGSLAQTLDLVRALGERCEELVVVCRTAHWEGGPSNVTVRTFDARTKMGRAIAFERALGASIAGADAVLVHMVPTFLALAAPLAKLRRTPLLLWYTHWHASRSLRVATAFADAILSVDTSSFPLPSPKVRGIGHAIDVDLFDGTPPEPHDGPLRFLALGRFARWKGLATLVEAFAAADRHATLELRGPALTADERAHRDELAAASAADDRVSLEPPVTRAEVPALLAHADVVVSPAEPRSGATLDKAVYEAAACARPVVTTNAALAPFLAGMPVELIAPPRDPEALGDRLRAIVDAGPEVRARIGAELRRRVVAQHSLAHWADAVVAVAREVRSSGGG